MRNGPVVRTIYMERVSEWSYSHSGVQCSRHFIAAAHSQSGHVVSIACQKYPDGCRLSDRPLGRLRPDYLSVLGGFLMKKYLGGR